MSDSSPLAVLYVDDDKDIRHIVHLALSLDPAIDLRMASGGHDALALLEREPWRPQLVLLDVMMPGMSGPDLMRSMRAEHVADEVPFVFITAKGREADQENYRKLGAAAVILKPFDPISLAARVRRIAAARDPG